MFFGLAASKKPTPRHFEVGVEIRVSMHGGQIVDAVIKAILDTTDGPSTKLLSDTIRLQRSPNGRL